MNMTQRQRGLPFEFDAYNETLLRAAHARTRLPISFEAAMRVTALAICLRRLTQLQLRKRRRNVQ